MAHKLIEAFVSHSSKSVARRNDLPVFLENGHSDSFDVFFEHSFNAIDEFWSKLKSNKKSYITLKTSSTSISLIFFIFFSSALKTRLMSVRFVIRLCSSWSISSDQYLLFFLYLWWIFFELSSEICKKVCESWLISWPSVSCFADANSSEIKIAQLFFSCSCDFFVTLTSFLKEVTVVCVLLFF